MLLSKLNKNLNNEEYTYLHKVNNNNIINTRGSNKLPSEYVKQGITYELKTGNELGLTGAPLYIIITFRPWVDLTAPLIQIAMPSVPSESSNITEYIRRSLAGTNEWGPFAER